MVNDEMLRQIAARAMEIDSIDDDECFVVNVLNDSGDYEIIGLNIPVGLFITPGVCAAANIVEMLRARYDNEYGDHEPWLIVFGNGDSQCVPLLDYIEDEPLLPSRKGRDRILDAAKRKAKRNMPGGMVK